MIILPLCTKKQSFTKPLMRLLSYVAVAFNLYLAMVLKFVLGEVCPVCISNYIVNLGLLISVNRITLPYIGKRD